MDNILAVDIGLKRIGVAISLHSNIVTPLPATIRKNRKQASQEVRELINKWNIDILVVGLPTGQSRDEMKRRFQHFVSLLNFKGTIFYQDEDLSSFEAKELIKGDIKEKRDGRIDSLSAKIILERYLDSLKNNL